MFRQPFTERSVGFSPFFLFRSDEKSTSCEEMKRSLFSLLAPVQPLITLTHTVDQYCKCSLANELKVVTAYDAKQVENGSSP
jgi:hypothetical protein